MVTCGRECDWVTQRSASRNATGLEVIDLPRSAWMVNWSRPIACLAQLWRISTSARAADSRLATIQPTTYRERDIQDHVEVVGGPFRWATQFRYIPRPHLIWAVGDEFGFHLRRMGGLPGGAHAPGLLGAVAGRTSTASPGRQPSSSRVAHTSAGARSANRSLCNTSRIACCSAALKARGCRRWRCATGSGRCRCRAFAGAAGSSWPARRPPHRRRPARPRCGEFRDGLVGHGVDLGSISALSESVSKSACSFACTSTTKRALASSCSNWRFSASRRAILSVCESRLLRPRGAANPASAPASRALRHSYDMAGVQALAAQHRALPSPPGAES